MPVRPCNGDVIQTISDNLSLNPPVRELRDMSGIIISVQRPIVAKERSNLLFGPVQKNPGNVSVVELFIAKTQLGLCLLFIIINYLSTALLAV